MDNKDLAKNSVWRYVVLAVKGLCMGAADVVPGVSGGTIAFVTGIYEELVNSIKSINISLFKLLLRGRFTAFWRTLNGNFLLAVLCGILLSVFSLSRLLIYLLDTYPIPVWSFFMGLVVASAIYVLKPLKGLGFGSGLMLVVGIAAAIVVCRLSPTETPENYWFVFLTGAIAICAMILPGISGSFVMLLLGKYRFMMDAVANLRWDVLFVFAAGAAIGIVSFSHVLSWLLKRYYNQTVCLLAGFMFGSVDKLWPWKETLPDAIQRNVLPAKFAHLTGQPAQMANALLFAVLGFAVVFGVEFLAKRYGNSQKRQ